MTDRFVPRIGGILSADIAVPEHDREVSFYSRVLTTGDKPLWRDDLMNNLGMPVIGLGPRSADYEKLPLQWMPHIQVADVAASAASALELGGAELMHGKNADGSSQWAVLRDPNGAAFGVIPVVAADQLPPRPGDAAAPVGRIAWLDLTVPDAAATRDFYRRVVGWSALDVEMQDAQGRYADYEMLAPDESSAAGVCHARGVNAELPPVWLIYLPVDDLAESLRRVRAGGGEVIKAPAEEHGAHAFAVVRDPVGACLALAAS